MANRGRYHGQRLTAKEVVRLYKSGERDFRGTNLRSCNFRGAYLAEADFSGADIRSARFILSNLRGTNFSHGQGGITRLWLVGHWVFTVQLGLLAGYYQAFTAAIIGSYLMDPEDAYVVGGSLGLVIVLIVVAVLARQGLTLRALGSVFGVLAILGSGSVFFTGVFTGAFAAAFAASVAAAFALSFTTVVTGGLLAAIASFLSAVYYANSGTVEPAREIAIGISLLIGVVNISLALYVRNRVRAGDPKFRNFAILGLAYDTYGGTVFSGSDLTCSNFFKANLGQCSFTDLPGYLTTLTQVRWHQAQNLDRARLGLSNLQDPRVRSLLTSLNGAGQDLFRVNLRGCNLAGAQLQEANLKGADLNGATLESAQLYRANLTKAQCIRTNFTHATFTGACLEAWNIDETTILKNIDCQHVFLKEEPDPRGDRERRPHDPNKDFQPGDFEKFFKEMYDTVKILIRDGVDPRAFKAAFDKIVAETPGLNRDSIQVWERQGTDVMVTLQVPDGTNKAKVEQTWDETYQARLQENSYRHGFIEGQVRGISEFKEIVLELSNALSSSSVQITNMNTPINSGDRSLINTGSMEGNVLNWGDLSGQVTVQINQLPDTCVTSDQRRLKDLLTELKAAVVDDPELDDNEKAEALGEVAKLAKAGTEPQDTKMQRLAQRATAALKSITEPLSEASKLATACKTLLPLIVAVF